MERQTVTVKGKPLEVVKIDVAWMEENYELFRQEYFSNLDMPPVEDMRFKVEVGRHKNWWGYAQYNGPSWIRIRAGEVYHPGSGENINRVTPEAMRAMGFESDTLERKYVARNVQSWVPSYPARYSSFTIALNNEDFLPEVLFEGTLVHEMVHIATMRNRLWDGGKSNAHDGWFKKIGEYITRASGGRYEIQRYVTKSEASMKTDIGLAMKGVGEGCLVRFVLTDEIETRSFDRGGGTYSMYYVAENPEAAASFVEAVKRNPGVIDYSRFKHMYPFINRHGYRFSARIKRADMYEMNRSAVETPQKVVLMDGEWNFIHHKVVNIETSEGERTERYAVVGNKWVKWIGDRAIKVSGGKPEFPITDNWIRAWTAYGNGDRPGNAVMRVMQGSGFLNWVGTVDFLGGSTGQTSEAPSAKKEESAATAPVFHVGEDPREYAKALSPGARKAFYSNFFDWYHRVVDSSGNVNDAFERFDLTPFLKDNLNDENRGILGDQRLALMSLYIDRFSKNGTPEWMKHWNDPVEAKESVLLPCDYSDEDRMAVITEGLLGDMLGRAGRAVKGAVKEVGNWFYRLVDRVKASVWNDEVDVQEHGDGTVTITMT